MRPIKINQTETNDNDDQISWR